MTRMSSSLEFSSPSSSCAGFGFGLAFGLRRARRGMPRGAVEAARWSAPRADRTTRGMDLGEVALALALAREETKHANDANHARHASANAMRCRRVVQRVSFEKDATFVASRRSRRRITAGGACASRSPRRRTSWSVSGIGAPPRLCPTLRKSNARSGEGRRGAPRQFSDEMEARATRVCRGWAPRDDVSPASTPRGAPPRARDLPHLAQKNVLCQKERLAKSLHPHPL